MSEEEKQIAKKEDDKATGSANNNQSIDDIGETSDYYSNDAIYSINDLIQDSEKDSENLTDVEATDVLMIEQLPEQLSIEQSSDENLGTTVYYEYPSDSEEDSSGQLPQSYFDNRQNLSFQENVNIFSAKDIHSLSKIREKENEKQIRLQDHNVRLENTLAKLAKNLSRVSDPVNKSGKDSDDQKSLEIFFKLPSILDFPVTKPKSSRDIVIPDTSKFVDHNSDEFADIEDNSTDSYDSCSDNGEFFGNIRRDSDSAKTVKSKFGESLLDTNPKHEDQVGEAYNSKALKEICNKCSSSSSETHEENVPKNVSSNILEPSCSYSPENKSKRLKIPTVITTKEGKTVKKNLSTVLEVPELEENNQNLMDSPSLGTKNSLKMRTRVGIRKDKCNVCNVRLGLCAIKCRCGGYYCAKHRYDKEHSCTFDYRSMGAEEIRKNNPRVIAEKVRKL